MNRRSDIRRSSRRRARSPFARLPQSVDPDQSSRDSRARWLWQLYASIAPEVPVKIPKR